MDYKLRIGDVYKKDKVIRSDGLSGWVTEADGAYAKIVYENGEVEWLDDKNEANGFSGYYLIGRTIIGDKVHPRLVENKIEANKAEIGRIKKETDILRKQAWRLRNQMNGEWPLPVDKKDPAPKRVIDLQKVIEDLDNNCAFDCDVYRDNEDGRVYVSCYDRLGNFVEAFLRVNGDRIEVVDTDTLHDLSEDEMWNEEEQIVRNEYLYWIECALNK